MTLLKKILSYLKSKNKKILITIDEVDNSDEMKYFIQGYAYAYQTVGYILFKDN